MRLDISKRPQLLIIYPTLIIVVAYTLQHIFVDSVQVVDSSYGVAAQQLYQLFEPIFYIFNKFSIMLYLIGGIILTRLSIVNMIFTRKSLAPLILYIIFSTSFFSSQNNIIEALTSLLIIISISRLVRSFRGKKYNFHYLFTASILMGITPLLIPQAIFILPILLIAYRLFKRSVKELIVSISGYSLPIVLYSYILWGVNKPFNTVFTNIYNTCSEWSYIGLMDCSSIFSVVTLSLTIIASIFALVIYNIKNKEYGQSSSIPVFILFGYIEFLTLLTLLISDNPTSLLSVLATPLAILISSIYIQYNNRFISILYIITVIIVPCIIVFNLLYPTIPQIYP